MKSDRLTEWCTSQTLLKGLPLYLIYLIGTHLCVSLKGFHPSESFWTFVHFQEVLNKYQKKDAATGLIHLPISWQFDKHTDLPPALQDYYSQTEQRSLMTQFGNIVKSITWNLVSIYKCKHTLYTSKYLLSIQ